MPESAAPAAPHRPTLLQRLGSLLPRRRPERSRPARLIRPWAEDARHRYPTFALTPARASGLLQAADAGEPAAQFELFQEMLQKWPRLAAVEATRRLALTGLDWEIAEWDGAARPGVDPDAGRAARASDAGGEARRVADHCRAVLGRLGNLRPVLDHLARAIGLGVAVVELVWEGGALVDLTPVPATRLATRPEEPWRLRVLTAEEPRHGLPLDAWPNKWIVHRAGHDSGRWFEGGLLRTSTLLYLAQNLSFKDWLVFSQVAGVPLRVAKFEPGASEDEKQTLLKVLAALGTDAVAVVSKAVELQLLEPARGGDKPYQPLQDHCNREITILWLGQHLTTDIAQSGSRAAAEIHDRVREDLLINDIASEGATLRRDLLTPIVAARFGSGVAAPYFRRSIVQSVDTKVLADTLAVAVRELGLRVPARWVHRALGIPQAGPDEPVLGPGAGL